MFSCVHITENITRRMIEDREYFNWSEDKILVLLKTISNSIQYWLLHYEKTIRMANYFSTNVRDATVQSLRHNYYYSFIFINNVLQYIKLSLISIFQHIFKSFQVEISYTTHARIQQEYSSLFFSVFTQAVISLRASLFVRGIIVFQTFKYSNKDSDVKQLHTYHSSYINLF